MGKKNNFKKVKKLFQCDKSRNIAEVCPRSRKDAGNDGPRVPVPSFKR